MQSGQRQYHVTEYVRGHGSGDIVGLKRLVRKTICFSKTTQMHDIMIGLFVNRYAFGRAV